jgi:hypothetical protein
MRVSKQGEVCLLPESTCREEIEEKMWMCQKCYLSMLKTPMGLWRETSPIADKVEGRMVALDSCCDSWLGK